MHAVQLQLADSEPSIFKFFRGLENSLRPEGLSQLVNPHTACSALLDITRGTCLNNQVLQLQLLPIAM